MVSQYIRDMKQEFGGYNASKLMKDALAGLTVAAVALPLALAFGVSSGVDAASGLITAIVAGLVITAFSGAFYQISGPTGAMAAILMSTIARYQVQGVFLATLMAGVFLLLAGLLRLGRMISWIPAPVITGFTSGIAIIIALGQVDNFFGVSSHGETAVQKLISYGHLGFSPDWAAVAIGLFVVVLMVAFPKKWNSVVPASLLGIILATVGSLALGLDVKTVGAIPQTLFPDQRLDITAVSLSQVQGLLSPAFSIAMLGMIESLLCGASAGRMAGVRMNADRELVAQGIGNMVLPFFGGIPATAAIARTSVAIKSGAQTRLAGIFHAVGLLLSMFVLGPVMSQVPLAALAGVLMVTAWRMNEWHAIRNIFSRRFKGAILKFCATMAATVLLDLTMAIVVGVLVGLFLYIVRSASIDITVENVDMSRVDPNAPDDERNWAVVYITGPMFFLTSEAVQQKLNELHEPDLVIFSMRGVSMVDFTAVGVLKNYYRQATAEGKTVMFSSIQPAVKRYFDRAGLTELAGEKAFYFSVDRVLKALL